MLGLWTNCLEELGHHLDVSWPKYNSLWHLGNPHIRKVRQQLERAALPGSTKWAAFFLIMIGNPTFMENLQHKYKQTIQDTKFSKDMLDHIWKVSHPIKQNDHKKKDIRGKNRVNREFWYSQCPGREKMITSTVLVLTYKNQAIYT